MADGVFRYALNMLKLKKRVPKREGTVRDTRWVWIGLHGCRYYIRDFSGQGTGSSFGVIKFFWIILTPAAAWVGFGGDCSKVNNVWIVVSGTWVKCFHRKLVNCLMVVLCMRMCNGSCVQQIWVAQKCNTKGHARKDGRWVCIFGRRSERKGRGCVRTTPFSHQYSSSECT